MDAPGMAEIISADPQSFSAVFYSWEEAGQTHPVSQFRELVVVATDD